MQEFRVKIGEDGRILIPILCRRKLNLTAGEEIILKLDENELHLFSLKHTLEKAQKLVKSYAKGQSLVKKLRKMRQDDLLNE